MSEDTKEYSVGPISDDKSSEWAKFLSKVLDTTTTENGDTDLRRVEEAVRLVNSIIDNVERMCTSGVISTKDAQTMVKQMLDPEAIDAQVKVKRMLDSDALTDPSIYTPSGNSEVRGVYFTEEAFQYIWNVWDHTQKECIKSETTREYNNRQPMANRILWLIWVFVMNFGDQRVVGKCPDHRIIIDPNKIKQL